MKRTRATNKAAGAGRPRSGGLRVGVTLYVRKGQQSLWENGIFQNCFFLVMLLNRAPQIDKVFIVNGGDGDPKEAGDFLSMAQAPVIDLDQAMDGLDVIIELSAQLNPEWATRFKGKGGRIVGMRVANDYVIDVERMMFKLPPATLFSGTPYDVIWTLPAFEKTCLHYYQTAMRAPVHVMQHLWSPVLLERALAAAGGGRTFGYEPGRPRWRLAVVEPNICSVKTAHLPMLLCDVAYRQDRVFIEYVRVFNAMALKEKAVFVNYARSLDLVRHGIATFEPRVPLFDILTTQCDAIVAHSWENEQNYVYYEALFGGYPLIHNSHFLDGCGWFYPDFDCDEGALALRQAFASHDRDLESYRRRSAALLDKLDPVSPRNVAAYGGALAALFEGG
jgi:hypothetical protein